jgi:hypothetical protein
MRLSFNALEAIPSNSAKIVRQIKLQYSWGYFRNLHPVKGKVK